MNTVKKANCSLKDGRHLFLRFAANHVAFCTPYPASVQRGNTTI
ncbi:hypothetical protein [Xenorhabdus stockiae]